MQRAAPLLLFVVLLVALPSVECTKKREDRFGQRTLLLDAYTPSPPAAEVISQILEQGREARRLKRQASSSAFEVTLPLDTAAVDPFAVPIPEEFLEEVFGTGERGLRNEPPVPIELLSDPNPFAVPIPSGAPTIRVGLVVTDASGYDQLLYQEQNYWGIRTGQQYFNSRPGQVPINGTANYVEIVALSGGPSCSSFVLLYDYLISVKRVHLVMLPVNPGCPEIALLAAYYEVPTINAVDYTVAALSSIPGQQLYNLPYVYSVTGNTTLLGLACALPLRQKGALTYAVAYDESVANNVIGGIEQSCQALGMARVINTTVLSPARQDEVQNTRDQDVCTYLAPIIRNIRQADPDLLIMTFGSKYTDTFVTCMYRQKYEWRAMWIITSTQFQGEELWKTHFTLTNELWVPGANYTDPHYVSVPDFTRTFVASWGNATISQISYAATSAAGLGLGINALQTANTLTDPEAFATAMDSTNYLSIIGNLYLVPSARKTIYHPFVCQQRGNDTNPFGRPVYPLDIPGLVEIIYPSGFRILASFLASIAGGRGLSGGGIAGIAVGGTIFVVAVVIAIVLGLVVWKKEVICIPKKDGSGEW